MTLYHEKTKHYTCYSMCYYDCTPVIITIVVNDVFLDGNFLSKFNLKIWFWFIQKNSWNESPKIAKFQK
jgi:hypothetical protein